MPTAVVWFGSGGGSVISNEKLLFGLAHSARLVSDVCAFARLRLITLLRAYRRPLGVLADLEGRHTALFAQLQTANQRFRAVEYGNDNSPGLP